MADVFKAFLADHIVDLNVHEYIHTRQQGEAGNLLVQCLAEGSCDFIAELVTGKPLWNDCICHGRANGTALKQAFKKELFTIADNRWLYNRFQEKEVADMGYTICKRYYNQRIKAGNKNHHSTE